MQQLEITFQKHRGIIKNSLAKQERAHLDVRFLLKQNV